MKLFVTSLALLAINSVTAFAPASNAATRSFAPQTSLFERQQGSVKWYNEEKGFGFIIVDDESRDLFVHITNMREYEGPLREGQLVEYEIGEGPKGPMAVDVITLD